MISAGLDVGSRNIKLVLFEKGVRESVVMPTGANPLKRCREMLAARVYDRLVVTGYGRHLVASELEGEVVSEIKAFATGARYLYHDCRTVIDIGGQDCKVIAISDSGEVNKFEMNDRCAAGTGKFLEVMASTLEVNVDEMGNLALQAKKAIQINSLCTVFAESEVVSLIAKGEDSSTIALALHESITTRVVNMVRRVGIREKVVLAGGAALNPCVGKLVGEKLVAEITIPPDPQIVGALGAALIAGSLKTV